MDRDSKIRDLLKDLKDKIGEVLELFHDKAAEPGPSEPPGVYVVKPGDTLWSIAEEQYGDGSKYQRIYKANSPPLKDPDKITPGMALKIPPVPK